MKKFTELNKALIYDRVNKFGGAERVLVALRDVMGPDLYTLLYNPTKATWAKDFDVHPSFFNSFELLRDRHEVLALLAPFGFESFKLDKYDLVVSVTSSDAKAVVTRPETVHVCYCLTPPRYLWEMDEFYSRRPGFGLLSAVARKIFGLSLKYMRDTDKILSARPDVYIAISNEVKNRIKKIYNRDSIVVYPPVDFEFFSALARDEQDYYLVVSRLVPYKKTSLVIKAFNELGHKLVVIGEGSEKARLKHMAASNVIFAGQVDDELLREYYAGAKALIFPQLEDFGITPLEAQAAGTPVIAFGKGGALETIVAGETGLFFESQSSGAIINAVKRFEKMTFDKNRCRENAKRFDKKQFIRNFIKVLKTL